MYLFFYKFMFVNLLGQGLFLIGLIAFVFLAQSLAHGLPQS